MRWYDRLVAWLAPQEPIELPPVAPLHELLRLLEAACADPARLPELCAAFDQMEGNDGWDYWEIRNDGREEIQALRHLSLELMGEDMTSPSASAEAHAAACAASKRIRDGRDGRL